MCKPVFPTILITLSRHTSWETFFFPSQQMTEWGGDYIKAKPLSFLENTLWGKGEKKVVFLPSVSEEGWQLAFEANSLISFLCVDSFLTSCEEVLSNFPSNSPICRAEAGVMFFVHANYMSISYKRAGEKLNQDKEGQLWQSSSFFLSARTWLVWVLHPFWSDFYQVW